MAGVVKKISIVSVFMLLFLAIVMLLGLCLGSSVTGIESLLETIKSVSKPDFMYFTIIWDIRFPRGDSGYHAPFSFQP